MRAIILALLLLSGCSTVVPVTQKFPEPPSTLAYSSCPSLSQLDETAKLSDVAKAITTNYTEYYTCAAKTDAWIDWYKKQKLLFEGIK